MIEPKHSTTCPRCGAAYYHPDDIREGYCGNCHDWTSNPVCPVCGKAVPDSSFELLRRPVEGREFVHGRCVGHPDVKIVERQRDLHD